MRRRTRTRSTRGVGRFWPARTRSVLPGKYKPGTVDQAFLREVAKLSWSEDGPRLAREFLAKHGIPLACLAHLPRTRLDGAALQLADGTPVIGLTLRDDRLDNFWFCLLHELAHIGRHLGEMRSEAFVDDLSPRDVKGVRRDRRESEADEWGRRRGSGGNSEWCNLRLVQRARLGG